MIGDGQVTMGGEIVKPNVKKVRRIGTGVIGGFAGAWPRKTARRPTRPRSHLRWGAQARRRTRSRCSSGWRTSWRSTRHAPRLLCARTPRSALTGALPRVPPRASTAGAADARVRGAGQGVAHGQVPAPLGRAFILPACSAFDACAHARCSGSPAARAQAVMVVADETHSLQITGTGDVLEPHDGIIGALGLSGSTNSDITAVLTRRLLRCALSHRLGRAVRAGGRARAHRHPGHGRDDDRCAWRAAASLSCADAARVQPSAP